MDYKITARIYQTNQNAFFRVVEKTTFQVYYTYVYWSDSEASGVHELTMDSNGTCGSLRFVSDTNESFIITLGVHNSRRCWGDIVTNLTTRETGVVITPRYYSDQYPDWVKKRDAQTTTYGFKNAQGRNFGFQYDVTEGTHFAVKIFIG